MSTIAEAAVFLAQQWPVFACAQSKRPVTPRGLYDATRDPGIVREQFRRDAAALIGVPTGRASGIIAIDIDVKDGAPGMEWLATNAHRLPRTRRHRTMSGGVHLLFSAPEQPIRNSVGKIAPGVDVRGEGGYVIFPPSPGYSIDDDAMPAQLPEWLLTVISAAQEIPPPYQHPTQPSRADFADGRGTPYALAALDAECDAIRRAPFGQQEHTLNAAALKIGALAAGGEIDATYARDALIAAGLAMPSQPGREPWTHHEIRAKVERALRDGAARPRTAPPRQHTIRVEIIPPEGPPYDEPPPWVYAEPVREPVAPPPPRAPDPPPQTAPPRILPTHPPLLDDETAIPPRRWIGGHGALPRGKLGMLCGPPGVSKTTLAMHVSIALAAGIPWGGIVAPDAPHRVVICAIEDDVEELQRRAHAAIPMIADHPIDRRRVAENLRIIDLSDYVPLIEVTRDGIGTETPGMADLRATLEALKPDVIWLDPLVEIHTGEESAASAMRPVMRALRTIAAHLDAHVSLLHHETKSGEGTALQRARGSGAIGGAIRLLWSLRPMSAEEAQEYQVADDTRDLYLRLETGKSQYARRAPNRWLVTEEVELANGDMTHRLVPWLPPSTTLTPEILNAAIACFRHGRGGEPLNDCNKSEASYRRAFADARIPSSLHTKCLRELIAAGTVMLKPWRDPADRKVRKRFWTRKNTLSGWVEEDNNNATDGDAP
jgi:KaiC/GvpD/RAD55 family RecA-like ATPase